MPVSPSKDLDAYLIVKDLKADIQIRYTNMGTAIAFGLVGQLVNPIHSRAEASLSTSVRFMDSNLNDLFLTTANGRGESDVQSSRMSLKPEEFSGGVNDAEQDLINNMMTEMLASQKIKDYAASIKTK